MSSKRSWSGGLQTTSEGTLGVVFGASFGFVDVAPRCTAFASWHVSDSVQFVVCSQFYIDHHFQWQEPELGALCSSSPTVRRPQHDVCHVCQVIPVGFTSRHVLLSD